MAKKMENAERLDTIKRVISENSNEGPKELISRLAALGIEVSPAAIQYHKKRLRSAGKIKGGRRRRGAAAKSVALVATVPQVEPVPVHEDEEPQRVPAFEYNRLAHNMRVLQQAMVSLITGMR